MNESGASTFDGNVGQLVLELRVGEDWGGTSPELGGFSVPIVAAGQLPELKDPVGLLWLSGGASESATTCPSVGTGCSSEVGGNGLGGGGRTSRARRSRRGAASVYAGAGRDGKGVVADVTRNEVSDRAPGIELPSLGKESPIGVRSSPRSRCRVRANT